MRHLGCAMLVTVGMSRASFPKNADSHEDEAWRHPCGCRYVLSLLCCSRLKSADSHEDEARGRRHARDCRHVFSSVCCARLLFPGFAYRG